MGTFEYNDYEGLCVAMAMIDAVIGNLENNEADEHNGWSGDLHRMRNEMNDARLALLKTHGDRVYHVEDIPAARQGGEQ